MKREEKIKRMKEASRKDQASIKRKKKQMELDKRFKEEVKKRDNRLYWEVVKEITKDE